VQAQAQVHASAQEQQLLDYMVEADYSLVVLVEQLVASSDMLTDLAIVDCLGTVVVLPVMDSSGMVPEEHLPDCSQMAAAGQAIGNFGTIVARPLRAEYPVLMVVPQ